MTASPYWEDIFMTDLLKPGGNIHVVPPLIATGPLGLCYHCCAARKQDPARTVNEAVTLAPSSVQIGDALGNIIGVQMVALPHCYACLGGTGSRLITG